MEAARTQLEGAKARRTEATRSVDPARDRAASLRALVASEQAAVEHL